MTIIMRFRLWMLLLLLLLLCLEVAVVSPFKLPLLDVQHAPLPYSSSSQLMSSRKGRETTDSSRRRRSSSTSTSASSSPSSSSSSLSKSKSSSSSTAAKGIPWSLATQFSRLIRSFRIWPLRNSLTDSQYSGHGGRRKNRRRNNNNDRNQENNNIEDNNNNPAFATGDQATMTTMNTSILEEEVLEMATFLTLHLGKTLLLQMMQQQQKKKKQQQSQQQSPPLEPQPQSQLRKPQSTKQVVPSSSSFLPPVSLAWINSNSNNNNSSDQAREKSGHESVEPVKEEIAVVSSISSRTEEKVEEEEVPRTFHQREGDRVLALGDEFGTGTKEKETAIANNDKSAVSVSTSDPVSLTESTTRSSLPVEAVVDNPHGNDPEENALNPTSVTPQAMPPNVISLDFGRPLEVVLENTPPLSADVMEKMKQQQELSSLQRTVNNTDDDVVVPTPSDATDSLSAAISDVNDVPQGAVDAAVTVVEPSAEDQSISTPHTFDPLVPIRAVDDDNTMDRTLPIPNHVVTSSMSNESSVLIIDGNASIEESVTDEPPTLIVDDDSTSSNELSMTDEPSSSSSSSSPVLPESMESESLSTNGDDLIATTSTSTLIDSTLSSSAIANDETSAMTQPVSNDVKIVSGEVDVTISPAFISEDDNSLPDPDRSVSGNGFTLRPPSNINNINGTVDASLGSQSSLSSSTALLSTIAMEAELETIGATTEASIADDVGAVDDANDDVIENEEDNRYDSLFDLPDTIDVNLENLEALEVAMKLGSMDESQTSTPITPGNDDVYSSIDRKDDSPPTTTSRSEIRDTTTTSIDEASVEASYPTTEIQPPSNWSPFGQGKAWKQSSQHVNFPTEKGSSGWTDTEVARFEASASASSERTASTTQSLGSTDRTSSSPYGATWNQPPKPEQNHRNEDETPDQQWNAIDNDGAHKYRDERMSSSTLPTIVVDTRDAPVESASRSWSPYSQSWKQESSNEYDGAADWTSNAFSEETSSGTTIDLYPTDEATSLDPWKEWAEQQVLSIENKVARRFADDGSTVSLSPLSNQDYNRWHGGNWASKSLESHLDQPPPPYPSASKVDATEMDPRYRNEQGGYEWYTIPKVPEHPDWQNFAKYSGVHWTRPDHD